jgi:hypothetical protein
MKKQRLVDWVVALLQEDIQKMIAWRKASQTNIDTSIISLKRPTPQAQSSLLDELVEIIELPPIDEKADSISGLTEVETMSAPMLASLREFVATVCTAGLCGDVSSNVQPSMPL